ncbi:MAG TPA: YidC/Oxa1 family membrane protein insertase [Candidatus Limiplasma sp.]|mgnify:CR=1 FL=1|nr:YidC/Oxa1 family membrane protein insertase [Candidatus Limiplasma sp.]HRX08428.1 YidC/Oxa1 family membrane protein insertase [Candidatus Limiplasma sp.]
MGAINTFLFNILSGINSFIGNYGWSIVIFTVIIKTLLLPLDFKSRKSMRRMSDLQPQVAKLQKKYANDKEKLNQKTAELYRKEHISPLSGCLPMLLSFPVLIAMFGAMRMVANNELAKQTIDFIVTGTQQNQGWLWVKNLWMPDSPFASFVATETELKAIPVDIWRMVLTPDVLEQLASVGIVIDTIDTNTYQLLLSQLLVMPEYTALLTKWASLPEVNLLVFKLQIFANNNGLFITPILAAVTQYLMTITQPQTPSATGSKGTGQFMKYFFPLFSLYICSTFNAGFSIYWVTANLIAWGEGIIINKMMEKQSANNNTIIQEDSLK